MSTRSLFSRPSRRSGHSLRSLRPLCSLRSLRSLRPGLAAVLAGLLALGSAEHGLTVAEASAATGSASPALAPGSGAVAQGRRPRKKRRTKATEKPAEPSEPSADEAAADGDASGAAGAAASDGGGSGSGGGSAGTSGPIGTVPATPAPATPEATSTTPEIASSAELVDVDALRQEYLQLRDELFKSRARASTLSSQLYSTKISIRFAFTSGRHYGVNRATIRLDGAAIFDDSEGAVANDDALRFEGYVAPGKHLLTFRIEATGKDDDRFTSAQEAQIALQAVAGKDLVVAAKAKDGGDIAYAWKRGEKGSYGLGIDVSVKTQKREAAK